MFQLSVFLYLINRATGWKPALPWYLFTCTPLVCFSLPSWLLYRIWFHSPNSHLLDQDRAVQVILLVSKTSSKSSYPSGMTGTKDPKIPKDTCEQRDRKRPVRTNITKLGMKSSGILTQLYQPHSLLCAGKCHSMGRWLILEESVQCSAVTIKCCLGQGAGQGGASILCKSWGGSSFLGFKASHCLPPCNWLFGPPPSHQISQVTAS